MRAGRCFFVAVLFVCALASAALLAQPAATSTPVPESRFSALHWRLVGPFRGGWSTAVAGIPGNSTTFYFGSADGGVWRTTDAGVTWQPIFNHEGSASIGALAIAPSDPRVLWAGTGHVQQRWDITDGDGIYRSNDGGESWTHVGLADTRHIGSIWIDPRNANVAVVAALGHVFGPNDERGIFRTEDGGRTWTKTLYRDPDTGAASIAGDPAVPDVLFASLWQVRRHPWLDYFQPAVGAGSGIYKSVDGGRTWTPTGATGLPTSAVGRIELGVSPGTSARRVWALIASQQAGGLYRSDDGGSTWVRIAPDPGLASDYTSQVVPDPRNPDVVWTMGRSLHRSDDGGKTFTIAKGAPGGDDYHRLWIDPTDPARMITGADQGAVVTLNGGRSWSSWYNQPTGQFYRLATDDRFPYWIYSGQQDSGTVAIASRSDYGQLTFRDWHPVGGDERDGDVPDPANPDIVYGAGLGGRLSKWFAATGQVQNVTAWPVASYGERPGTARYRYSWITPLAISRRAPRAVYMAAQVLFQSVDGGQSWKTISPDLTGAVEGAKGCEGDVPVERATACGWGVIFAIAPSPAADGLVWVGTDNGRVQVTRDGGTTWTNVTPPDMRDWTKVNIIDASSVDAATAYVAADRHRLDDFRPLAWRTHDFGKTWTEIGHGLPAGAWVGVVREDPKRRGLLFAGTSRGVFVSFDDGNQWQSLQRDLPRTGINDLVVHGDDVVVATQGRAIWALDAIEPLRHAAGRSATEPFLVPPAVAYRLRANNNKDTPLPPEEPRAANPPVGAILDYVLPDNAAGPVVIEIVATQGAGRGAGAAETVVRRFSSDDKPAQPPGDVYFAQSWLAPPSVPTARRGHNRFVWDLRYPAPHALEYEYSIAAVPGGAKPTPEGAFVLPGSYEVRLTVGGTTLRQPLTVVMDPRVKTPPSDLAALLAFQREVEAEMARSAQVAQARTVRRKQLEAARNGTGDADARAAAERALAEFDRPQAGGLQGQGPAAIHAILASLARDLESADLPPTQPQRELLAQCRAALK
ncbi:MAG: WD40/YVTN/BNR-like repeat-containing protein [Bacteroidales bacterium]